MFLPLAATKGDAYQGFGGCVCVCVCVFVHSGSCMGACVRWRDMMICTLDVSLILMEDVALCASVPVDLG